MLTGHGHFVPLASVLMTTESRHMVLRPSRPRRPKWSMSSTKTFIWSDLGLSSLSTPDEYIFCISAADMATLWVVWSIPCAFKSFKSPMKKLFSDMKARTWAILICRECGADYRWQLIAAINFCPNVNVGAVAVMASIMCSQGPIERPQSTSQFIIVEGFN